MLDITLDTCILVSGSLRGSCKATNALCQKLLYLLDKEPSCLLVLDKEKHLVQKYRDKLKDGSFGRSWLGHMITTGRIHWVSYKPPLTKACVVALNDIHFDPEDRMFVRVAANSSQKRVATHDVKDFSPAVCKAIKKHHAVVVNTPDEAIAFINGN